MDPHILKQMTGNDRIEVRALYSSPIKLSIQQAIRFFETCGLNHQKRSEFLNMILLKRIYHAHHRKTQLNFCDQLIYHSDEFRYRPNGIGYLEVRERNKGKFADLKN